MASSREKCNLQQQLCFLFIFTLLKGHFSSSASSVVGGSCDTAPEVTPRTNLSQPISSPGDPGSLRGLKQFTSISGIKIIKKCSTPAGKSAWAKAGVPQPGCPRWDFGHFVVTQEGLAPESSGALSQRQISCGSGCLNYVHLFPLFYLFILFTGGKTESCPWMFTLGCWDWFSYWVRI